MQQDRLSGVVSWFSDHKGYGYLLTDDGTEVYVHHRAIRGDGFTRLHAGQRITFAVGDDGRGAAAQDVLPDGELPDELLPDG